MTNGKDFLFDIEGNGDLLIRDGDFVIGPSDQQNVKYILEAQKGQIRMSPYLGVGIRGLLGGFLDGRTRREIQLQLEKDGYRNPQVTYKDEVLAVKV